jgi:flagellar biosynthetic protein FlhB
MQNYAIHAGLVLAACVAPVVIATTIGGCSQGPSESVSNRVGSARDHGTGSIHWRNEAGLFHAITGAHVNRLLKLSAIVAPTYGHLKNVLSDPIFYTAVDVARIAEFLAETSFGITWRVIVGLILVAALDYAYQFWRTSRDLMMTRQEVKDDLKSAEGNPQVKARQRRGGTSRLSARC